MLGEVGGEAKAEVDAVATAALFSVGVGLAVGAGADSTTGGVDGAAEEEGAGSAAFFGAADSGLDEDLLLPKIFNVLRFLVFSARASCLAASSSACLRRNSFLVSRRLGVGVSGWSFSFDFFSFSFSFLSSLSFLSFLSFFSFSDSFSLFFLSLSFLSLLFLSFSLFSGSAEGLLEDRGGEDEEAAGGGLGETLELEALLERGARGATECAPICAATSALRETPSTIERVAVRGRMVAYCTLARRLEVVSGEVGGAAGFGAGAGCDSTESFSAVDLMEIELRRIVLLTSLVRGSSTADTTAGEDDEGLKRKESLFVTWEPVSEVGPAL